MQHFFFVLRTKRKQSQGFQNNCSVHNEHLVSHEPHKLLTCRSASDNCQSRSTAVLVQRLSSGWDGASKAALLRQAHCSKIYLTPTFTAPFHASLPSFPTVLCCPLAARAEPVMPLCLLGPVCPSKLSRFSQIKANKFLITNLLHFLTCHSTVLYRKRPYLFCWLLYNAIQNEPTWKEKFLLVSSKLLNYLMYMPQTSGDFYLT